MNITDIYTSDYSQLGASRAVAAAQTGQSTEIQGAAEENTSAVREDTVVKSDGKAVDAETGIYSREKIIEQLKNAEQVRVDNFRKLIESMISGQAEDINLSIGGLDLHVTEADSQAALEAVSPGGEYSVEAVTDRIMDMAEALAGGDPSKIEELRDAVIQGFEGAASALGLEYDGMPDITKETYTSVMKRFDEWAESFTYEGQVEETE